MTAILRRRVRHPVAAVAAWSSGVACAAPWLLEPPLWVRVVAGLLTALTCWLALRLPGAAVAVLRDVVRGRARPWRVAVPVVLLLALASCTGARPPIPAASGDAGPPASAVADVYGALRVRVGLQTAGTDAGRARLAVERLVEAGGTRRSTVLVAVPTGSGWVDESAVAALERLTGGDLATVTVEYARHPSWVEYLLDEERAGRSAVGVLRAVRSRLAAIPAGRRPRLLVFGESLGATAAARAVRELGPVDGCLLAGRPGSADAPAVPGCVDVRNGDDPIPWWRPRLLVAPPAGLPWLPVATFWQITGSMLASLDQGPGHGHRYGSALGSAWAGLIQSTRSSAAPTTVSVSRPW
jgi:uncharacterized membrane protein